MRMNKWVAGFLNNKEKCEIESVSIAYFDPIWIQTILSDSFFSLFLSLSIHSFVTWFFHSGTYYKHFNCRYFHFSIVVSLSIWIRDAHFYKDIIVNGAKYRYTIWVRCFELNLFSSIQICSQIYIAKKKSWWAKFGYLIIWFSIVRHGSRI